MKTTKDVKPTWIIEYGVIEEPEACEKLKAVLEKKGCPVRLVKVQYFKNYAIEVIDDLEDQCVICMSSLNAAKQSMRAKHAWYPGYWCDWDNLSCRMYYSYWHEWLLNKNAIFLPYRVIVERKEELYKAFGDTIFIRPDTNDKLFSGEPVSKNNFDYFVVMMEQYLHDYESPMCVVGPAIDINEEYRLVMSEGKFVTGSQYRDSTGLVSKPGVPSNAIELAEKAAQKWSPHPIFVLDIAQTLEGPKILECGSINCAGMYEADLDLMVDEMNRLAIADWKEYFTDE